MMAMNCTTFTRMPVLLEILRSDWPFGRPRLARLYALTATMRPVQLRRSPMAIIHRLATRLSIFSFRARMEALIACTQALCADNALHFVRRSGLAVAFTVL